MRANGLFVIMAIVFIFAAWVATGGPSRPISSAGPFITPVTRSGEESQGYRYIVPNNPINTSSYPKQVAGASGSIISSGDSYARTGATSDVYLERSTLGPAAVNPNQEYLALVNAGDSTTYLGGWRLRGDAYRHTITVPGLTLAPGEKLILVTGRSASRSLRDSLCRDNECVYLDRNFELWGASRETITLTDTSGTTIDSFSY